MNDYNTKKEKFDPLSLSWHDLNWIPHINATSVLDYFAERSNPFYDHTCNNEVLRMQRASLDQLQHMVGLEYILLHVQEPILYVIRKQMRHSQTHVTPVTDYYIIEGRVYQAPDLQTVFNSRMLTAISHLTSAFEECNGYARYHPSKGYSWEFKKDGENKDKVNEAEAEKDRIKEESSSAFQRARVDALLNNLVRKLNTKNTM